MSSLSLVAARRRVERIPSSRQQQITANLSLISRTWPTLTDSQRQGFTDLSKIWSPNGKGHETGLSIFQSLNGCRLNSGLSTDILTDAPQCPDFIGRLPDFTLAATRSAAARPALKSGEKTGAADSPAFALLVQSGPFTGPVVACATRPLSSGVTQASPRQFAQIATLATGLNPSGTTDLAGDYLFTYWAPAVGMKVAVQLYPLTANGFRGNAFTQIVLVTAATP